jgi:DNA-binding NarL/FixJ family response regulator
MIRVLIVDDQGLVRAGFRALLEAEDDIEVVGEASEGQSALRLAVQFVPDVVLMDIRKPELDGIEATRRIAANDRCSNVRVVILTTYETDDYVFDGLRAGASGFMVKDTSPTELLRAVRVVASGDALLAPSVTRRLIADVVSRAPRPGLIPGLDELTPREREILGLVASALSNDEIADRLTISPTTAKTHVSRIMGKLGARDRAQLVVFAYESRTVTPTRLSADAMPVRPSRER